MHMFSKKKKPLSQMLLQTVLASIWNPERHEVQAVVEPEH